MFQYSIASSIAQLRASVRKLCEKELVPIAAEIDHSNDFPQMKVSTCALMHYQSLFIDSHIRYSKNQKS